MNSKQVDFFDTEAGKFIRDFLWEKNNYVAATGLTNRTVNHWTKMGLLEDSREDSAQWNKFNIIQITNVKLLLELRKYITSLKLLAEVALNLNDKYEDSSVTILEMLIVVALCDMPVYIAVGSDGKISAMNNNQGDFEMVSEYLGSESFLIVHLNPIVNKILPGLHLLDLPKQKQVEITMPEKEMLEFIRQKDFKEVKIRKNDKEFLLEGTTYKDVKGHLNEILKSQDYQNIEIVMEGARIKTIKQTSKKKIKTTT